MSVRALLALAAALCAVGAHACSIPVFRYALDHWPADPYTLRISASDAQEANVARFLRNFTDSMPLNLVPVRLKEGGTSSLFFPHAAPDTPPVWSGALDGATLPRLTESPARAEIVRRILDGEAGVWVLVESGEREVDDRAAATIEKRLRYLEQVAQLPQIDPYDPSSKLGPGPALRVQFSLLRLKRDDFVEQPFLRMLAGPKMEGAAAGGPWFALVFGRGRVLGAWPVEGFGDEQIDETCLYLLGACSCEVKRLNPGWDVLLNADWDGKLQAIGFPSTAAEAAPKTPEPIVETMIITPAGTSTQRPSDVAQNSFRSPLVLGAGILLVLGSGLAGWVFLRKP